MNDHANHMFRVKKRQLRNNYPPIPVYPSDPNKDELIGRLKASLEWSQRETQEHKIMMGQNALFRRVAELTNERNALQAGFCPDLISAQDELKEVKKELERCKELLAYYQSQSQEVHLPPAVIETPNQVTILEGDDKETVYTYISGEWVALPRPPSKEEAPGFQSNG